MTETEASRFSPANNSFEAWNINFYESKAQSTNAWALAYALLGFWNMNGKGRCNPSSETLLAKTRMKSKHTLRKAIQELEETGEWVVVKSKGRKSHHYYPMFVKNARLDLLYKKTDDGQDLEQDALLESDSSESITDENNEQHVNLERLDTQDNPDVGYVGNPYVEDQDDYPEPLPFDENSSGDPYDNRDYSQYDNYSDYHESKPESPESHSKSLKEPPGNRDAQEAFKAVEAPIEPLAEATPQERPLTTKELAAKVRIRTPEDVAIKKHYEDFIVSALDTEPDRDLNQMHGKMHLVLEKGDCEAYGMIYDKFNVSGSNAGKHFVLGGQGFLFPEELAPRWVEQFHLNYGSEVFTYASINKIYEHFLNEYDLRPDWDKQMNYVDAAMFVLGNDGFVPSVKALKAVMFGTRLDGKMKKLQEQFEETKIGREITHEYINRGLYAKSEERKKADRDRN